MKFFSFSRSVLLTVLLTLSASAGSTTTIRPTPLSEPDLIRLSTHVIEGEVIGYSYRRIDRLAGDFGAEIPAGGPRSMEMLEAHILVRRVLFQKRELFRIQTGDVINLWLDFEEAKWPQLLNKKKIYTLKFNPLTGPDTWIGGFNTKQWPLQELDETKVYDAIALPSAKKLDWRKTSGLD